MERIVLLLPRLHENSFTGEVPIELGKLEDLEDCHGRPHAHAALIRVVSQR